MRAGLLTLVLGIGWSAPGAAATFVVDTTSDAVLATCGAPAADCSLRGAISNAVANAGSDTVDFDPDPDNSLDYASNFLRMCFAVPSEEYVVNPILAKAMDRIFTLHADHEQNCSTSLDYPRP